MKLTDARRNTLQACRDWAAPFEIVEYRNDATGEIVSLSGLLATLGWLRNRGLVEYGMMNDTWRTTPAGRAALQEGQAARGQAHRGRASRRQAERPRLPLLSQARPHNETASPSPPDIRALECWQCRWRLRMNANEKARKALEEARDMADVIYGENRPSREWALEVRTAADAALAAIDAEATPNVAICAACRSNSGVRIRECNGICRLPGSSYYTGSAALAASTPPDVAGIIAGLEPVEKLLAGDYAYPQATAVRKAADALASIAARLEEVERQNARLNDMLHEAQQQPWPEWAVEVVKVVRKRSGYDGYDDASDGVDLPSELDEALSELEAEADRWKARAEAAEAENDRLRGELARVERETIERAATEGYVAAVKHCSARDGKTLIGHPVGHGVAAAIRALEPRHD